MAFEPASCPTFDNLRLGPSALPPTSNEHLNRFVQSQQQLTSFYAEEGASYASEWERDILKSLETSPGEAENQRSNQLQAPQISAFATPILKARVTRTATIDHRSTTSAHEVQTHLFLKSPAPQGGPSGPHLQATTTQTAPKAVLQEISNSKTKRHTQNPSEDSANGPESKTRKPIISQDDEHKQRLAERRERRRAKRNIAKPPTPSPPPSVASLTASSSDKEGTSSKHNHNESSKKAQGKKTKNKNQTKKTKTTPGMALMQSFSANNVGKARITLKPSMGLGLFGKGKSSGLTGTARFEPSINSKKRKEKASIADLAFSEFAFLRPAGSKPNQRKRAPSASPAKSKQGQRRKINKKKGVQVGEPDVSFSDDTEDSQPTKKKGGGSRTHLQSRVKGSKKKIELALSIKNKALPSPQQPLSRSLSSSSSRSSLSELGVDDAEDQRSTTPRRYISPPWLIDGEIVGDEVSVHEPSSKTEEAPAAKSSVQMPLNKVLRLDGRWGFSGPPDSVNGECLPTAPAVSMGGGVSPKAITSRFFQQPSRAYSINTSENTPLDMMAQDMEAELLAGAGQHPTFPKDTYAFDFPARRSPSIREEDAAIASAADPATDAQEPVYDNHHYRPMHSGPPSFNKREAPGVFVQGHFHDPLHERSEWSQSQFRGEDRAAAFQTLRQVPEDIDGIAPSGDMGDHKAQDPLDGGYLDEGGAVIDYGDIWHAQDPSASGLTQRGVTGNIDSYEHQEDSNYENIRYTGSEFGDDTGEIYIDQPEESMDFDFYGPSYGTGYAPQEDMLQDDDENDYFEEDFADLDDSREYHRAHMIENQHLQNCDTLSEAAIRSASEENATAEEIPAMYEFNEGRALLLGVQTVDRGDASVGEAFAKEMWKRRARR